MHSRKKKFISYYRPYLRLFIADMACAFVVSATTLALPLCTRFITKSLSESNAPHLLGQISLVGALMVALVLIHIACRSFVDYQGHMMGAMMESDIRRELFEHYQKLSFGFYDEQRTGQLMTRISNDSLELSELFHHGPEDIVISLLNFIGAFIILTTVSPQLASIVFSIMALMAVYAFYFNKRMKLALRKSKDRVGDINAQVEDTLAGIRVVQSFTNEEIEKKKFAYENNRFVASRRDVYKNEAYFFGGMTGFTQMMSVSVIIFGSIKILSSASSSKLDLADLVTFLLCVGILIEPINRFSNFARLYQEGIASFERIMELLETKPEIQDRANAIELPSIRGNLEFKNVSFKYNEEHGFVIENISLKIKAGESVALVGASGVGKTTLCSLIPRFYEVSNGAILLDGQDTRDIQLESLRRNIGVVQQDVYLFSGTVADNIRYGRLDAEMEEIIEAAKKANAHEFIMALPNGYQTDVGQRGVKLSGGQKQRLSIARVFLKNPPVILFDEATSALDNESERAVQESMERLAHHRTTLVIAHRLSTVRKAHRIIVLTENGIGEQGTHEDLLALNGVYAGLYNSQLTI